LHDVIIVGGGPAGCEAAWRCASSGLDTLLLTTSLDGLYWPAGGSAVLAGQPGSLTASIRARLAPEGRDAPQRARDLHRLAKEALEGIPALHLLQSNASALLAGDDSRQENAVQGIRTWEGLEHHARVVALCAGSFLHARLSAGQLRETAGRPGEMAYDDLYLDLVRLGFEFEAVTVSTAAAAAYPHSVACMIFAASEFAGPESFRFTRFGNLFAAGFCKSGYLSFAAAAGQGRALGARLEAALREGGPAGS
jgi:tRNA U34 5-carboxymethylaminomethyl modifying enzyme MnmG/GidA